MTDVTATAPRPQGVPSFGVNLHDETVLRDPHPLWKEFRAAGGVVWLEHHQMYALAGYPEVVEALTNWRVFASGEGVGMNPLINALESTLAFDPPRHDRMRAIENRPLLPKAVRRLEPQLREAAERTVLELRGKGTFDGVADLASVLPVGIVAEVVGLPEDGRANMLRWAAAGFNSFGLLEDPRTQEGLMIMAEASEYMESVPDRLKPGSWGAMLVEAERNGELEEGEALVLLQDYIYPSLDTTILAIASGLELFSENPDQWALLRAQPDLLRGAVNEIMRLASPIQWFTRYVREDHELGGITLPAGSRAVILYGSANRDERRFPEPERFDITRKHVAEHVGWGKGKHACVGMPLARLEIHIVFEALVKHVERIETGATTVEPNTTLWGYRTIETRLL